MKMYGAFSKWDLKRALKHAPAMSFASQDALRSFNNVRRIYDDTSGVKLAQFAEDWARLMEAEMLKGHTLTPDVVDTCQILADVTTHHNADAFVLARDILTIHWEYGKEIMSDEFRQIHGDNPDMRCFYVSDEDVEKSIASIS